MAELGLDDETQQELRRWLIECMRLEESRARIVASLLSHELHFGGGRRLLRQPVN